MIYQLFTLRQCGGMFNRKEKWTGCRCNGSRCDLSANMIVSTTMGYIGRLNGTVRIILHTLLPPDIKKGGLKETTRIHGDQAAKIVAPDQLPYLCADFTPALDEQGNLALFFPECLPPAAIFLLFRLKRTGFSNGRARLEDGGILLTAVR